MKKIQLLFLCILFLLSAHAQKSIDLFTLSGRYGMPTHLENVPDGQAIESGALVNLKIPVVLSDASIWYSELSYTWFHVGYNRDLPDTMAAPITLNGFVLQTGLVKRIDDSRQIHLLAAPRFMTDFNNTGSNHWQLGGVGLFEKRFHKDLMMRFGILYNQEFFGPFLVPLVYIDWHFSGKWSISGLLPIYGKLNYHVNENLTIGFSEFGLITSYRLGKSPYQGDYIERKSIDLCLFARQRLAGNFHLEGRAGYALSREYGQYAADQQVDLKISIFSLGDDRIRKNVLFEDGPIFNMRLVYNLPLE
ncbi:MAG: hypothetical protein KQI35_06345 [Bacteroidetes bacterium]|nr:hypothetical protein [Bacteroidota bacterium]